MTPEQLENVITQYNKLNGNNRSKLIESIKSGTANELKAKLNAFTTGGKRRRQTKRQRKNKRKQSRVKKN